MKSQTKLIELTALILVLFISESCIKSLGKNQSGKDSGREFSGIYEIGMEGGSTLDGAEAVREISRFCANENVDTYIDRIAKLFSFNAGYEEHPDSGYDAVVIKQLGDDGEEGYYVGKGEMTTGSEGLGMEPSKGRLDYLVKQYCSVALNSLIPASMNKYEKSFGCAYPEIEVSRGGSVNGTASSGRISASDCTIIHMQNKDIRHDFSIGFCEDEMAANFKAGGLTSNEMSLILTSRGVSISE